MDADQPVPYSPWTCADEMINDVETVVITIKKTGISTPNEVGLLWYKDLCFDEFIADFANFELSVCCAVLMFRSAQTAHTACSGCFQRQIKKVDTKVAQKVAPAKRTHHVDHLHLKPNTRSIQTSKKRIG